MTIKDTTSGGTATLCALAVEIHLAPDATPPISLCAEAFPKQIRAIWRNEIGNAPVSQGFA